MVNMTDGPGMRIRMSEATMNARYCAMLGMARSKHRAVRAATLFSAGLLGRNFRAAIVGFI